MDDNGMSKGIACKQCGIVFTMQKTLHDVRFHDQQNFFCPNGHALNYMPSSGKSAVALQGELREMTDRAEFLRRENISLQAKLDQLEAKMADLNGPK